jgi:opacity protein-like surface antigen
MMPLSSTAVLALEGGTFSLRAGVMFPEKSGNFKYNSGYLAGIGVGLKSGPLNYGISGDFIMGGIKSSAQTSKGNVILATGFFNMRYDFEGMGSAIIPYLGAGAGYVMFRSDITPVGGSSQKKTNHTGGFQAKAGLMYLMSEEFGFDLGYQYFRTLEVKSIGDNNFSAHQALLGVTWFIG